MTDEKTELDTARAEMLLRSLLREHALPLETVERVAMEAAIERADGSISRAAKALGIGRTTLYRFVRRAEGRTTT